MAIGSTTATCGSHIFQDKDLDGTYDGYHANIHGVGTKDGSSTDRQGAGASYHSSITKTHQEGTQDGSALKLTPQDNPVGITDGNALQHDENALLDALFKEAMDGDYNLDDIMVSAIHAKSKNNVTPDHLSKIWRIDVDTAKRTLDITSQQCARKDNPKLSRNYETNDRMLRYKHLNDYFFMDTLFATSKASKSSRGHTCAQLFVTDKGFVYIVPMKKENDVLHAVKQFAKAIGAPDAIICDASKAQKAQKVKQFCNDIGTTLKVLERNTPWANKAEL